MAQAGIIDWAKYKKPDPVWLSGREIGTGDNLLVSLEISSPALGGGVDVGGGHWGQVAPPSPRAPTSALDRSTYSMTFAPQLDEDTDEHVEAAHRSAAWGKPRLWLPLPYLDTWLIESARTQYSTAHTISGNPGDRGVYHEPIVRVTERDGEVIETLSFAASSPGATEFTLPGGTTVDNGAIVTGDLSARSGKLLRALLWVIMEVELQELPRGFLGPLEWSQDLVFRLAPTPKDFEADV